MVRQGRVGKRKAAQRQMGRGRSRTWVGQGKERQGRVRRDNVGRAERNKE